VVDYSTRSWKLLKSEQRCLILLYRQGFIQIRCNMYKFYYESCYLYDIIPSPSDLSLRRPCQLDCDDNLSPEVVYSGPLKQNFPFFYWQYGNLAPKFVLCNNFEHSPNILQASLQCTVDRNLVESEIDDFEMESFNEELQNDRLLNDYSLRNNFGKPHSICIIISSRIWSRERIVHI